MKYDQLFEVYQNGINKLESDWTKTVESDNIYNSTDKKNKKKDVLIMDGIVNPAIWFDQDVRPLFVLKEAYDSSNNTKKPWNEINSFVDGSEKEITRNKTWSKLCSWAYDIFGKEKPKKFYWNDDVLKRIAVINIKKYGGQNPSDNKDLLDHATRHSELVFRQIELIKPTVIVCGYTGWLLDEVWKSEKKGKLRNGSKKRVQNVCISGRNVVLIDFWHPTCRKDRKREWEADMNDYHEQSFQSETTIIDIPEPPQLDDSDNEDIQALIRK